MEIPRISAPSTERFDEEFVRASQPVVITDLVPQWPSWGRWSLDWFEELYGHLELSGNNALSGSRTVLVSSYLQSIRDESGDGLYLDALPLDWLPGMEEALLMPPYLPSDRKTAVHVWVGPGGTCLEFHKDNHTPLDGNQNLLCQLMGKKKILLVSPAEDFRMYPAPQKPGDYLRSQVRLDRTEDFPLFEGATLHTTEVGPGDMLYIPAHWWHYVRSLEPSMTVTFWWRASRIIELLGQFAEAARAGSLPSFLADHSGSLGLRDVEELGGESALREVWAPLSPRVQQLCTQLLSAEVARLVAA